MESTGGFNLLNVEGRRLVISNIRNLLDIVLSVIYFGNPSKTYMKSLLDLSSELLECIFLQETNSMFPQIKRDAKFLNILDRFNKLQKAEEIHVLDVISRITANERRNSDSTGSPS
jgi:hypothetical protein